MKLINFDVENKGTKGHHFLLPPSIRCVICGPSGCGKTNLILNLLINKDDTDDYLKYDQLYIYSKSLSQDKYVFLRKYFDEIHEQTGRALAHFYSSADDIIPPEDLNSELKNILVFDDVMLEKQTVVEKFFSQGRHGNADCFYLCQSYFRIPKQVIRDNANLIVLFNQDIKHLRAIFDTFVSGDMPFDEFNKFYSKCVGGPYGFCVIDLTSPPYNGKYRSQFDNFYIPYSCFN